MFGVDSTELLIIALAALVFIGPKELPGAMRQVGRWVGRARAHARHFTAGIENMMREAELEEMETRWRQENERIMREHPFASPYPGASDAVSGPLPPPDPPLSPDPQLPPEAVPSPAPQPVSEGERSPPAASLTPDEPGLPLPDPEHHRRELP
ncbi:Sec-independent protein translocase subunit TatA/TatB [Sphingomonas glaciei]|uniref:Twin-arginine translocase subunit TatB n=1 Tax=Sphingomonas glaciei TaxID=2938948 RepID=A0ABY5MUK5_9SPHN|nr:twin-arginine translocase subunit TatB [Sphingomonas glaciei]UUR07792.1 twin-arginine translocase subunit TatB [Sphingomonas glaciei]